MRQLPFNMKKEFWDKATFKDQDSGRRVITVRGKTSAVVAMFGAPGEGSADIMKGFERNLPRTALCQVESVSTDAPNGKLLEELKKTLPDLVCMSLGPVHPGMHYEGASARKKPKDLRFFANA